MHKTLRRRWRSIAVALAAAAALVATAGQFAAAHARGHSTTVGTVEPIHIAEGEWHNHNHVLL